MRFSAISVLVLVAACDDDHGVEDPCGEPDYGGEASDEAWKVVVDQYDTAAVGTAEAVTLTSPGPGETIDAAGGPPTFSWTSPIASGSFMSMFVARADDERGWLAESLDAIGDFFVGTAHAHLPPVTGDVYYLEVKIPGRECAVRGFTSDETWTLDASDWAILKGSAGADLELIVTSAYLTENRVTEGPYRAAPRKFKVQ